MAGPETHRIKIRMGDVEFDAEGNSTVVAAQYDAFLATLRLLRGLETQGLTPRETSPTAKQGDRVKPQPPTAPEAEFVDEDEAVEEPDEEEYETALSIASSLRDIAEHDVDLYQLGERNEVVLPRLREAGLTPPQALLVLLLGYVLLKNEDGLTGIWLMRSLKGSGYSDVERIDELVQDGEEIATHGQYRGKRYTLTDVGGVTATELLSKVRVRRDNAQSNQAPGGQPAPPGA